MAQDAVLVPMEFRTNQSRGFLGALMQVGNLRARITFEQKSVVKDSSGQDVHTWVAFSPHITRSASIKPLKGREVVEARARVSELQVSVMVRYDSEVNSIDPEQHRIRELSPNANTVYAIHAKLNERNLNRWLEFWCSEGAQDIN